MASIRKLLCPTDFSDNSMVGLRYAVKLAAEFGAQIELLHVHHVPLHKSDRYAPTSVDEIAPEVRKDIERSLRDQVAELHEEAPGVVMSTSLEVGVPYERIAHRAVEGDADIVVLSALGQSSVTRLLLGSVAERTARTCKKPVITVPIP